jgi:hypothetical protein
MFKEIKILDDSQVKKNGDCDSGNQIFDNFGRDELPPRNLMPEEEEIVEKKKEGKWRIADQYQSRGAGYV